MRYRHFLLSGLVALSFSLSACQSTDLAGRGLSAGNTLTGITPAPKGQKPQLLPTESLNQALNRSAAEKAALQPGMPQPAAGAVSAPALQPLTPEGDSTDPNAPQPTPAATLAPSAEPGPQPSAQPTPEASATPDPETSASPVKQAMDFFYFSYDDSASTAGVELTKYALNNGFATNTAWARPWEFMNYESFVRQNQTSTGLFKVSMGLWQHGASATQESGNLYDLGVHVSAPELDPRERPNLVLTLVVDVSGSMNEPGPVVNQGGSAPSLLALAKIGLESLAGSLKAGDVVHLVTFSDQAKVLLDNFTYRGDSSAYLKVVRNLKTEGSTNLNAGISSAYALAQKSYQPGKLNRVLMLTDAFANMGEVDPAQISQQTRINNAEGIYFSGLGFGQNFNEAFLNQLTEAGRGAYFSVITRKDAERAFQERFMALMTVAARDVRFRLDYPAALKHTQSAAEEVSKDASKVQPTNFSYNTSQYFWERFQGGDESLLDQNLKLTIEYTDPSSGERKQEVYERQVADLLGKDLNNIKDARMITLLTALIKKEVTPAQAQAELAGDLGDHASALATEYRKLIEAWLKLNPTR
jgi:Ca-activated chloride channel family protein